MHDSSDKSLNERSSDIKLLFCLIPRHKFEIISEFSPLSLTLKIDRILLVKRAYESFLKPNKPNLFVFLDLFEFPRFTELKDFDYFIALNNYSVPP